MNGAYVTNAKFNSNTAIVYDMFEGIKKIKTKEDQEAKQASTLEKYAMHEKRTFSIYAQRRMQARLDNFYSMMMSVEKLKYKPINNIRLRNVSKVFDRKPVFLTLTVPDQQINDKDVKKNMLDPLLYNLGRSHNIYNYIWKAEAQENGNIHFHIALDSFVDYKKVKKLWYKYLVKNNCEGQYLKAKGYEHATRISWFKVCDSLDTLKFELSGYFGANRDENGELVHKHDRTKRVRDIEGNSWGCSDTLKYKAFTLNNISNDFYDNLYQECLKRSVIEDENGTKRAEVFVFKKAYKTKHKDKNGRPVWAYNTGSYDKKVRDLYGVYHFEKALNAYSKEPLYRYSPKLYEMLYNNSDFDINVPDKWIFQYDRAIEIPKEELFVAEPKPILSSQMEIPLTVN